MTTAIEATTHRRDLENDKKHSVILSSIQNTEDQSEPQYFQERLETELNGPLEWWCDVLFYLQLFQYFSRHLSSQYHTKANTKRV